MEDTAISVKSFCDGCSTECRDADLTSVGRYDPCVFCPDCLATWRAHEAAERATHAEIVREFEAWRAAARAALKIGGPAVSADGRVVEATRALARLPDEG